MSTHMHSYTYTAEQWGFHKRQAGKQPDTHSHVYNVPYKRDFFFSSFLSRLNKQTWLSHSLYSCADFCVSVCFNLNGFQVPSLPKSASSFSPLIQQLTLKLSSFSLSLSPFSHFLSTLKRHHSVPSITLNSSLLFLPLLSVFSPLSVKKQISRFPSLEANTLPALTSRVQEVVVAASLCSLVGSDLPRFTASVGEV